MARAPVEALDRATNAIKWLIDRIGRVFTWLVLVLVLAVVGA